MNDSIILHVKDVDTIKLRLINCFVTFYISQSKEIANNQLICLKKIGLIIRKLNKSVTKIFFGTCSILPIRLQPIHSIEYVLCMQWHTRIITLHGSLEQARSFWSDVAEWLIWFSPDQCMTTIVQSDTWSHTDIETLFPVSCSLSSVKLVEWSPEYIPK